MSGKPPRASAHPHPSPYVFDKEREKVVENFRGTAKELRTSLELCEYGSQFIGQHLRYYYQIHSIPKPTLSLECLPEASLLDLVFFQSEVAEGLLSELRGSPFELSSGNDSKCEKKEEHMESFGSSMLAAAAHAGHHPHHTHPWHVNPKAVGDIKAQSEAAGFAPPLVRGPRKSMFDLRPPPTSEAELDDTIPLGAQVCARLSPAEAKAGDDEYEWLDPSKPLPLGYGALATARGMPEAEDRHFGGESKGEEMGDGMS